MIVSGTEGEILRVVGKLGKTSKNEISKAVGFTVGYIEMICNYLIRKGCLVKLKKNYILTEDGEKILLSLESKNYMVDEESLRNITTQVAKQVAKEVVAEIKASEVTIKRTKIYPRKRVYPKEGKVYPEEKQEEKQEIRIKTDFNLAVEDESLALESNIDKIGIKSEKEKSSIDKVIGLLKNIRKKVS